MGTQSTQNVVYVTKPSVHSTKGVSAMHYPMTTYQTQKLSNMITQHNYMQLKNYLKRQKLCVAQ